MTEMISEFAPLVEHLSKTPSAKNGEELSNIKLELQDNGKFLMSIKLHPVMSAIMNEITTKNVNTLTDADGKMFICKQINTRKLRMPNGAGVYNTPELNYDFGHNVVFALIDGADNGIAISLQGLYNNQQLEDYCTTFNRFIQTLYISYGKITTVTGTVIVG